MKLYFKYVGMLLKSQMQYKASFIMNRTWPVSGFINSISRCIFYVLPFSFSQWIYLFRNLDMFFDNADGIFYY